MWRSFRNPILYILFFIKIYLGRILGDMEGRERRDKEHMLVVAVVVVEEEEVEEGRLEGGKEGLGK